MTGLGHDLRYAVRQMRRSPGFTAVAVLTLALGIGANTAIFSVVHAVLLRPLPYPEPGELVKVWETPPEGGHNVVSSGNYLDWREEARSFEALGAHSWRFGMALGGGGEPVNVQAVRVTPSALRALGASAHRGRTLTAEEGEPGGPDVALVSHGFWRQRLGGDPTAVGRTLALNDERHLVVGVLPPGFDFPSPEVDVWLPLRFGPEDRATREAHQWNVLGRLAEGATLASARAEMEEIARRIAQRHPVHMTDWGVAVVPLRQDLVGEARTLLLILSGVVVLVLLVACANLANLLLARATDREQELAVRRALGAGGGRLIRQLLAESLLLGLAGGALALASVALGLRALVAAAPTDLPLLSDVRVDPVVLAFTGGITLLATLLFGLLPAWRASRAAPRSALAGSPGRAGGGRHGRARAGMLVGQVALTLVLLVGAGLLVRSFLELNRVEHGFEPRGLLTVSLDLPSSRYDSTEEHVPFFRTLLDRVRGRPGVAAAAGTAEPPVTGYEMTWSIAIEGRPANTPSGLEDDHPLRVVTPGYFRTVGIPLLRGRTFRESDRAGSPRVAVINESLARTYWPDSDPLGHRIATDREGPWFEIVGVVGDTRHFGLDEPVRPAFYLAHAQKPWAWMSWLTLMVRAENRDRPEALLPAVREAVWELDDALPLGQVATVEELYAESAASRRFARDLVAGFAALALLLGSVGLSGVLAYGVARRRREIGVRIALGARPGRVAGGVLREGLAYAAAGAALGAVAALGLTRFLEGLLYGVSPLDPLTFASVTALLLAVACAASWVPARRAAAVDPMTVLREE